VISDSEDERNANVPTVRTTWESSVYKPSTLGSGDGSRPSKRQKGKTIEDSDDDREAEIPIIKSRDAYMLIYTRREVHRPSNGAGVEMREREGIPAGVSAILEQMEQGQAAAMTAYHDE
jgi:hypothetical protein